MFAAHAPPVDDDAVVAEEHTSAGSGGVCGPGRRGTQLDSIGSSEKQHVVPVAELQDGNISRTADRFTSSTTIRPALSDTSWWLRNRAFFQTLRSKNLFKELAAHYLHPVYLGVRPVIAREALERYVPTGEYILLQDPTKYADIDDWSWLEELQKIGGGDRNRSARPPHNPRTSFFLDFSESDLGTLQRAASLANPKLRGIPGVRLPVSVRKEFMMGRFKSVLQQLYESKRLQAFVDAGGLEDPSPGPTARDGADHDGGLRENVERLLGALQLGEEQKFCSSPSCKASRTIREDGLQQQETHFENASPVAVNHPLELFLFTCREAERRVGRASRSVVINTTNEQESEIDARCRHYWDREFPMEQDTWLLLQHNEETLKFLRLWEAMLLSLPLILAMPFTDQTAGSALSRALGYRPVSFPGMYWRTKIGSGKTLAAQTLGLGTCPVFFQTHSCAPHLPSVVGQLEGLGNRLKVAPRLASEIRKFERRFRWWEASSGRRGKNATEETAWIMEESLEQDPRRLGMVFLSGEEDSVQDINSRTCGNFWIMGG